jgi:hypothetical protein
MGVPTPRSGLLLVCSAIPLARTIEVIDTRDPPGGKGITMRTGTGARQAPRASHARLRALIARLSAVTLVALLIWSVSGRVAASAPGSPVCRPLPKAATTDYLVGRACPPSGFAGAMGYEPVLLRTEYGWRYTKPAWAGGYCTAPLSDHAPFWNFRTACQTHDYGYDLVRYGVGDRAEADSLLYRDMMAGCAGRGAGDAIACKAVARWTHTVLVVGDATGFDPETVSA